MTEAKFLTLQQATDLLKKHGVRNVKMTRAYKRRDHREVLLEGLLPCKVPKGLTTKAHGAARQAEVVSALGGIASQLRIRDPLEESWNYCSGDSFTQLGLFCRVQLPTF